MTPRIGIVQSSQLGDDWTATHHLPAGTPAGEAHTEGNPAMTTPLLTGDTLTALIPAPPAPDATPTPEQVAELVARNTELEATVGRLAGYRDAAVAEARQDRATLDLFRTQVRDVAIRVAEERDWCDPGLNEVLAELGLDPKETEWEVTVTVTAHVQKTITVTAADEDDARAKIRTDDEDCVSDQIESGDFDWDDDDIEIDAVDRP